MAHNYARGVLDQMDLQLGTPPMPAVKPPCVNTHEVVYKVRGWEFTTKPMSEASAMLCIADFCFANPHISYAATLRKL